MSVPIPWTPSTRRNLERDPVRYSDLHTNESMVEWYEAHPEADPTGVFRLVYSKNEDQLRTLVVELTGAFFGPNATDEERDVTRGILKRHGLDS